MAPPVLDHVHFSAFRTGNHMNKSSVESYCRAKPGAVAAYPFGPEPLVFKVAGKMFALIGARDGKDAVSLKCDPDRAWMLRGSFAAITAGYHLNKEHWNTLVLDGSLPEPLISDLIDHSYALVVGTLSKNARGKLRPPLEEPIDALH